MIAPQPVLNSTFTSTGEKLFHHQEMLAKLRNGYGQPVVAHVMPTDICNYRCAFCSVQYREGDALPFGKIEKFVDDLLSIGLKATIISGGGNPILYRCPDTRRDFNDLVDMIHGKGLEIGCISNGMPMKDYGGRMSWKTVRPETLDKLTWLRISLAGWDHPEQECFTPDIDPSKTTLGGSYVLHDQYVEPLDKKHGRVSTLRDIITPLEEGDGRVNLGMDRLPKLKEQMAEWAARYKPQYVRLLPNCLEPEKLDYRAEALKKLAQDINPDVFFVQVKGPRQPHRCLKGYPHPVANCDGWVYPCDSVVLNQTAGHKFGSAWRMCRMGDILDFYARPIAPNVPNNICPGCVFSDQVDLISAIADGLEVPTPTQPIQHVNFV